MVVVGYIRVSTLGQVTDGNGLDTQTERIRAWCAYQGLPMPIVESDPGVSGKNANRPGLNRAIRAVVAGGPGSVLVVYKIDRLGRDSFAIQEVIELLMAKQVRIVSITEGLDSAGATGSLILKLLISILATVAELERETILTRLRDGRENAKVSGRVYCRLAPFGYAKDEAGKLVECPTEMAALVEMRRLRAEGKSFRQIARRLELLGYTPREGAWDAANIRRLIVGRSKPQTPANRRITRLEGEYAV